MSKYSKVIFIVALTLLICGCPLRKMKESQAGTTPAGQKSDANTAVVAAAETAPVKTAEPNKAEPNSIEPNKPAVNNADPNGKDEPNAPKPQSLVVTEPNKTQPVADSNQKAAQAVAPVVSFHENCASILKTYVDKNGRVDYGVLKRKRLELRQVLDSFAQLKRETYNSWPEKDKLALWVNAYNMQMLNIIVTNYPIQSSRMMRLFWSPDSIRHINGIWTEYKFIVMDEEFTLNDIETRFFAKDFNDPRVFLVLTQASLSSPPLRTEPYTGSRLDEQLDEQVKRFLADKGNFSIDREQKIVRLSSIFDPAWFGKYFIRKYAIDRKFKDHLPEERAILNFLSNYLPKDDVKFMEVENYKLEYTTYDWRLNAG